MAKQSSMKDKPGSSDIYKETARSADDTVSEASETIAGGVHDFGDKVRAGAAEQAEKQQAAASESLDSFAQAIHKASEELRNRDQTFASRLVGEAGSYLESLSDSLSHQRPEDLLAGVRDFGRRNPAAFVGGAVLAGLALGRFARSSGERDRSTRSGTAQPATGSSGSSRQPDFVSSSTGAPYAPSARSGATPGGFHE